MNTIIKSFKFFYLKEIMLYRIANRILKLKQEPVKNTKLIEQLERKYSQMYKTERDYEIIMVTILLYLFIKEVYTLIIEPVVYYTYMYIKYA